jgi:Na+-translocating ferredoxin:NAD+ oxidoreductase RnfD subunit
MKNLTLVINTLLMAIFGLAAGSSQFHLQQVRDHPDSFYDLVLPLASLFALDNQWICWAVPIAWLLVSILTFAVFHRDDQRFTNAVQLHTSLTLFVGVVMLSFFVLTSIVPFVPLILG